MSAEPQNPIATMIDAAGIQRIICVDDAFAFDGNQLVELLAGFDGQQRSELVGRPVDEMNEPDVWQQRVRDLWDEMSVEEQATLVDNAYAMDGGLSPVPSSASQVFEEMVPTIKRLTFTLEQWRSEQAAVLAELADAPTLILFDQNFQQEGGREDEGQRLIADLQAALNDHGDSMPEAFYGLLTNVVDIESEHERRQEILAAGDIDPARFVVISKQSLQDEQGRFASRLRTTLLAPMFEQLMTQVSTAVAAAQEQAIERARAITPEDLEHMVVLSSGDEGVWPPDTMLRVLEVMQRQRVRESLRSDEEVVALTERLGLLADAQPVEKEEEGSGDTDAEPEPQEGVEWIPESVKVAHEEIYESAEHINGLHLPIELGDLFRRDDDKLYVVIAQPCDLMVRRKGHRAPDISHMLLAEVDQSEPPDKKLFASFELPYFDPNSGASAAVKLDRPAVVRAAVLDACVLNADGRARLALDDPAPSALLPNWRMRRVELHKLAKGVLARLSKVEANADQPTREAIAGSFKKDPFKLLVFDPSTKVVEWNCVRAGRVREAYARALLSRFSQHFARDAYLHDLVRQ